MADEIATLYGVNVFKVYDTPCYKAVCIKGINPDNKVFSDQRFVDYNQANGTGVGEMQVAAGHVAQLSEDQTLNWTQILPFSVQRTILNMTTGDSTVGINRTIIPLNTTTTKALDYAIKHADEIDVLNISIENPNSNALNNVITEAVKAGITVVASAGSYGSDASSTTPANNPNVLTVSAIGDSNGKCGGEGPPLVGRRGEITDDCFAYFSNFGPTVKVAAPGVEIFSTYNGTGYAVDTGTSMAAPHVAGAAALYNTIPRCISV